MVIRYFEPTADIQAKEIQMFKCPECGFEFNAIHEVDDDVGGWECPLCEVDELKNKVSALKLDRGIWKTKYLKEAARDE